MPWPRASGSRRSTPLPPSAGPSGVGSLTARTGAHLVVADRPAPADTPCRWVELAELVSDGAADAAQAWTGVGTTAEGGIVLSSSGTTGRPKVMRLSQDKLLHAARSVVAHHRLTESDRGFNPLPLFHINAEVVGLLSTLVAGASLVLDDRFHRSGFWALVGERNVTWINAVPAIISRLAELQPGETVPPGSASSAPRRRPCPSPPQTASRRDGPPDHRVVRHDRGRQPDRRAPALGAAPRGSVGVPVGLELRVIRPGEDDPDRPEVAEDGWAEVGEVEIRGASVIDAYEGGVYTERFRAGGWLRTGDLGRLDEEGYLYLVARTDDVINRGGEKVFPREIEEVISADPAVVVVAVVGQDDGELGQVPVAYVVLDGVEGEDDAQEAAHVAGRLHDELTHKLVRSRRPVAVHVVASMPAGATGKVQRHTLGRRGRRAALHVPRRLMADESPLLRPNRLPVPGSGSTTSTPCDRSSRSGSSRRTRCSSSPR